MPPGSALDESRLLHGREPVDSRPRRSPVAVPELAAARPFVGVLPRNEMDVPPPTIEPERPLGHGDDSVRSPRLGDHGRCVGRGRHAVLEALPSGGQSQEQLDAVAARVVEFVRTYGGDGSPSRNVIQTEVQGRAQTIRAAIDHAESYGALELDPTPGKGKRYRYVKSFADALAERTEGDS